MRKYRGTAALLAFFMLLAGCKNAESVQAANADKPVVLAYYTGESNRSLNRYGGYFDVLSTDTLNTDATGNLVGGVPEQALERAEDRKMDLYALVSNYGENGWDTDIAGRVLNEPKAKIRLIRNMLDTVRKYGYDGINIDFEEVRPEDREALSRFVRDTAREMGKYGKKTMVSVPAKMSDDPENGWSGAFDYAALGRYADLLQVMTYDEHGMWSDPGSSAGLDWIDASLKFAVSEVKPSKVLMGLPAYGNDWNLSDPKDESGSMLTWTKAHALARKLKSGGTRDAESLSMVLRYTAPGGDRHVVWYEDAYSVKMKTRLVGKYKLAGISVYALGMEDGTFWQALKAGLKPAGRP
ncbi:glycosyl hydrolase family 18 protein [Saccharibacillus alkalitolerans]|uniref:Spore protein O n=1 Tax=Saccharibacillus alkalitolerans TaxID=2705290 RepID=A0ABX0F7K3_9BACL|nr:glycosyl hydrolase family 18 protein [Saccharibacillus alkalitolerans]NGZ76360.1 spore protein O [Saccharibacillus alkalitolerans]